MRKKNNKKQRAAENFLKALYHRQTSGTQAKELPSVSGTVIKEMIDKNWIKPFKNTYVLTPTGENIARDIIRKHRIIETYLARKTGTDIKLWHPIAERKEHSIDEQKLERLEKDLGYPLLDPHGDPIPLPGKKIPVRKSKPLSRIPSGPARIFQIIHIEDEPHGIYERILKKGLYPGIIVRARKTGNNFVLQFEGLSALIDYNEASQLSVKQVAEKYWNPSLLRLSSLQPGESGKIIRLADSLYGLTRQRLLDLGFVRDAIVRVYLKAPAGEPVAYDIKDATVALRKEQAGKILIEKI
jgi:DtxR family Mn-dependent transcriptional regulator